MPRRIEHPLEMKFDETWAVRSWRDSHVVLAVSGGPDSVAMLRAARALKQSAGGRGRLHVAHLNHQLRGCESDADQAWLEALCRRLDVPLEVETMDVAAIAAESGDGLESAARAARYDFLARAAERIGARFVAVGHTADDQAETVLHHILRGTGLAGLAGMSVVRPLSASASLVRPLLRIRREEVLGYLQAMDQAFRTDVSNADLRWTRNRLRAELLPLLRAQFNADVDSALVRLAAHAEEAQQLISQLADDLARGCVTVERACVRIDCRLLANQPPLVVREAFKIAWQRADWPLQAMGFDQWQQLAALARSEIETPLNLPGNIRAQRAEHVLILEKLGPP